MKADSVLRSNISGNRIRKTSAVSRGQEGSGEESARASVQILDRRAGTQKLDLSGFLCYPGVECLIVGYLSS